MDDKNRQAHQRIALLSTSMTSKNATKEELDELYKLCKDKALEPKIRRDAIISAMQVLVSLLPDYTVGKHSAKDNISRDVRQRREEEKLLLDFTRKFIQYCELMVFGRDNSVYIRAGAAHALSQLFLKKRRFNTGDVLAKSVVRLACLPIEAFSKHACAAIVGVFKSDPYGEDTLKIMTKVAETATPKISVGLLVCLKSIQLKPISGKVEKPKLEDKELARDLKEVGIIDSKAEQQHNQAAILEHLFGTVFRFLKETKSEEHFCAAMDVVKAFVNHLNIDVVPQIVEALKQKRFSLRASIIAANTAMDVCKAAKLTVDLRSFYTSVYARAYEALEDREVLSWFLTLFEQLGKDLDKRRAAAFAKRLVMMALQAPTDVQGLIIAHMRQMIIDNVAMSAFVDFEDECESFDFNLTLDDPDSCNGPSAKLWELAHLANSHNPLIAQMARELATMTDDGAVTEVKTRAAKQRRDWSPKAILEILDESKRIFDVNLFNRPKKALPTKMKLFEFE